MRISDWSSDVCSSDLKVTAILDMVGHLTESDGGDDRALVQRTVLARQRFGVARDGFEHGEVRRIDVLTDPVLDELRELGCHRELFQSAGYAERGSLKSDRQSGGEGRSV